MVITVRGGDATGIEWVEGRCAAKHTTTHRKKKKRAIIPRLRKPEIAVFIKSVEQRVEKVSY